MSKKLEINQNDVDEAVQRYRPYWETLDPVNRELAEKVVTLAEYAGGRKAAADAMGVAVTTLDNYRTGKTQPKFLELVQLAVAAGQSVDYLLNGLTGVSFRHPSIAFQAPEINRDLLAKIGSLLVSLHTEVGIRLPFEETMRLAAENYNRIVARAENPFDIDELEALLPWLESRIRKSIEAARAEPGTGKREAS